MVKVNHDQSVQVGTFLLAPCVGDTLGVGAFVNLTCHEDEERQLLLQGGNLIFVACLYRQAYLADDGGYVVIVGYAREVFESARPRWTKNCLLIVKHWKILLVLLIVSCS